MFNWWHVQTPRWGQEPKRYECHSVSDQEEKQLADRRHESCSIYITSFLFKWRIPYKIMDIFLVDIVHPWSRLPNNVRMTCSAAATGEMSSRARNRGELIALLQISGDVQDACSLRLV